MKKQNDHTPKASAWEDILKQGDFETQLGKHLSTLPDFSPQENSWKKITAELDRKPTIPLWARWSAAAAVTSILLLSLISLERTGDQIQGQELLTENPFEIDYSSVEVVPSESPSIKEIIAKNVATELSPKKKVKRSTEIIEAPKMTLPEIALLQTKNIILELPETPVPKTQIQKTLHQVSISWNKIKPGMQVKTSFGRLESELEQKPQASAVEAGQITVEINN